MLALNLAHYLLFMQHKSFEGGDLEKLTCTQSVGTKGLHYYPQQQKIAAVLQVFVDMESLVYEKSLWMVVELYGEATAKIHQVQDALQGAYSPAKKGTGGGEQAGYVHILVYEKSIAAQELLSVLLPSWVALQPKWKQIVGVFEKL